MRFVVIIIVQVDSLLTMISPLVTDQKDQPEDEMDPEDFSEEQTNVARFISLLQADEPDQQYVVCYFIQASK